MFHVMKSGLRRQFHQYRQSEQPPLILTELTEHLKKTMTYDFGKPNPDPLYNDIEIRI
jgi:hypothetical protein